MPEDNLDTAPPSHHCKAILEGPTHLLVLGYALWLRKRARCMTAFEEIPEDDLNTAPPSYQCWATLEGFANGVQAC